MRSTAKRKFKEIRYKKSKSMVKNRPTPQTQIIFQNSSPLKAIQARHYNKKDDRFHMLRIKMKKQNSESKSPTNLRTISSPINYDFKNVRTKTSEGFYSQSKSSPINMKNSRRFTRQNNFLDYMKKSNDSTAIPKNMIF
mmetsp:Transcript_19279/g.17103  ORF Transcript_19279/g.17103 Transcript_19279/m.17103 type:complete len:139 (+) Transcript_19279:183-599(+)